MAKFRADDKYQGLCLQSYDGSKTIDVYDRFSPELRAMIRSSDFNLCPVCVSDIAFKFPDKNGYISLTSYRRAIKAMEAQIRCEEVK